MLVTGESMEIIALESVFMRPRIWGVAVAAILGLALAMLRLYGSRPRYLSSFASKNIYCPQPWEVRPFSCRGTGIQRYSASDEDDPDFPPVHINECRQFDNAFHGKECGPPKIGGPQLGVGLHIDSLRSSASVIQIDVAP